MSKKKKTWGKERRNKGFKIIKLLTKVLHRSLSLFNDVEFGKSMVPQDVKEGQFAVFAVKGEESKRFVLELCYLNNPTFLRLLEKAEEEYGFKQMGALAVPCQPEELQKILQERREKNANAGYWTTWIVS